MVCNWSVHGNVTGYLWATLGWMLGFDTPPFLKLQRINLLLVEFRRLFQITDMYLTTAIYP